jgi:hypothetical protein
MRLKKTHTSNLENEMLKNFKLIVSLKGVSHVPSQPSLHSNTLSQETK